MRTDGTEPCNGLTHIFFPERDRGAEHTAAMVGLAKRLCAGCDKRLACHVGAMTRRETDGVWGGSDFFPKFNLASRERRAQQHGST